LVPVLVLVPVVLFEEVVVRLVVLYVGVEDAVDVVGREVAVAVEVR
jgi:hypothetical protein